MLDLASKKLPIIDFVYTHVWGKNLILKSGYLGFEKLCSIWQKATEEKNKGWSQILKQIKFFLEKTAHQNIDIQNQNLAHYLAKFVVSLDVNSLCMVERLKARILASQQSPELALNLFNTQKDIEEVRKIMELDLPKIPQSISNTLSEALKLDKKGWMNQFTRLENATNFSQFISYIEHIISRSYYHESLKQGKADISFAMGGAKELALTLVELHQTLKDKKKFRAWKSIFLLDVLSRMQFQ